MADEITAAYADAFDAKREVFGITGDLVLLDKRDENDEQLYTTRYRSLLEIVAGWYPKRTTRFEESVSTRVDTIRLQIAETAGDISAQIGDATHVSWMGQIRSVQKLYEPVNAIRVWTLFVDPTGEMVTT